MAGYEGSETVSGKMIFEPILEEGVFRFDCSADDRNAAFPSISFENPKVRDTPLVHVHKVPTYIPSFERVLGQQIVTIEFPPNTSFYGTGEVSGQLERTGKRVSPFLLGIPMPGAMALELLPCTNPPLGSSSSSKWRGIRSSCRYNSTFDMASCEQIDLRKEANVKLISSSPYPVITFGPFASPVDVLASFSRAVGTVFMPPKWSLGYHQCRWSYHSDARVREIVKTFREKGIPCDVIWMDIDYMDGFRCFTFDKASFNPERFPDPKTLADDLHQHGFKAIWMLDPGIKKEEGYFVYDSGSKRDIWIQTADGKPFVGDVWPGPCVFPDYTQSSARSWWSNLVKDFISNGVDGIWNDMNEPAVFKTVTKTMPESNIHRGDSELGGRQNHSHYHNVYGMLMARSTYEGMKLANEQKRPFVLTRAGFVGSQRYAATWTGDNLSTWEHLHMSISMVVQLGLSGQPLSGPDIGGFAGNATPKLFGRWMGVGSMFPFCRGHSETDTIDHEPWSFGEEPKLAALRDGVRIFWLATFLGHNACRGIKEADLLGSGVSYEQTGIKEAISVSAHIYTLFYMAHTRGIPVATPHFLLDLPALYLQGGSIIPVAPPYQHVGEANPTDDLSLLVALNENGKAEGVLFEDDGDGYEYSKGGYLLTTYVAEKQSSVVTVKVLKTEGSWKRPNRWLHVQLLLGKGAKIDAWGVDGEILQIPMPSESEVSDLVLASEKQLKTRIENAKPIPDLDNVPGHKGTELSRTPVEVKSGDWALKVVPWIGW
ncbi:UNVERIFIED_CONTAM: Alpha-glucosidase 2 [Sesamum radiatum]|uniref:Alpha-glucosidase 2 n=1 Tax=Sesamum radiatum TaxID=300843 RepID=A0AAW2TWT6_SESRA